MREPPVHLQPNSNHPVVLNTFSDAPSHLIWVPRPRKIPSRMSVLVIDILPTSSVPLPIPHPTVPMLPTTTPNEPPYGTCVPDTLPMSVFVSLAKKPPPPPYLRQTPAPPSPACGWRPVDAEQAIKPRFRWHRRRGKGRRRGRLAGGLRVHRQGALLRLWRGVLALQREP